MSGAEKFRRAAYAPLGIGGQNEMQISFQSVFGDGSIDYPARMPCAGLPAEDRIEKSAEAVPMKSVCKNEKLFVMGKKSSSEQGGISSPLVRQIPVFHRSFSFSSMYRQSKPDMSGYRVLRKAAKMA